MQITACKKFAGDVMVEFSDIDSEFYIRMLKPNGDGVWKKSIRYNTKFTPLGNGYFWASDFWLGSEGVPIGYPFKMVALEYDTAFMSNPLADVQIQQRQQ